MRVKPRYFLILLLLALVAFTCAQAAVNPDEPQTLSTDFVSFSEKYALPDEAPEESASLTAAADKTTSFKLPASLKVIEDGAFEGTALVSVDIPESVTHIGERAFANIPTLLGVHIPDNTQYIGKDAFAESKQVMITASSNSYARTWAKDNGYDFQVLATFSARDGMIQYSFRNDQGIRSSRKESIQAADKPATNIRERRTGRTAGELKASRYKGVANIYIQSRYFP